jgi:hypothetical protein
VIVRVPNEFSRLAFALALIVSPFTRTSAQPEVIPYMVAEPDECFISVVTCSVDINITASDKKLRRHLRKDDIACARDLIDRVEIRVRGRQTFRYQSDKLRKLIVASSVDTRRGKGGWLITDNGLKYVSNEQYQQSRLDR